MRILLLLVLLVCAVPALARSNVKENLSFSVEVQRASRYHAAIRAAAARYGVSPYLLWTIAYLETRFRPELVSAKGARGLMQFIPSTGRRYGLLTRGDLHDPARSIDAAARYVRDLCVFFDGRVDLILAAYNAGENAVINSGNRVPSIPETKSYVARGLSLFRQITRTNILAIEPEPLHQAAAFKPAPHGNHRRARATRSLPSKSLPTRSIYFPL